MVAVVLPNDRLALQLPQPRVMIAARRHQVRRVGRESAVPDPALMAVELLLQLKPLRLVRALQVRMTVEVVGGLRVVVVPAAAAFEIDSPDAGGVVGGAGGEVADVRGEEHAGDVGAVGAELGDGDEAGDVADGDETPDVDGAVDAVADGGAEEGAVGGDGDGGDALVLFRDELVAALVLAEVPDADVAAAVAGDELALVGVDDDVVDGDAVGVVSLDVAAACVPDFHGAWGFQVSRRSACQC